VLALYINSETSRALYGQPHGDRRLLCPELPVLDQPGVWLITHTRENASTTIDHVSALTTPTAAMCAGLHAHPAGRDAEGNSPTMVYNRAGQLGPLCRASQPR